MSNERDNRIARRTFLQFGGALAAAPRLGGLATRATTQTASSNWTPAAQAIGRRRLGKLEVSSIGLGVQNMRRKYETTVPYRPQMLNIIRRAFDSGVTFLDTRSRKAGRSRLRRTNRSKTRPDVRRIRERVVPQS